MTTPKPVNALITISSKPEKVVINPDQNVLQINDATKKFEDGFTQDAFDILHPLITTYFNSSDNKDKDKKEEEKENDSSGGGCTSSDNDDIMIKGAITYISCCIELNKEIELYILSIAIEKKMYRHELHYYVLAASSFLTEEFDMVESFLRLAIRKNPDFGYAYLLLGHFHSLVTHEEVDAYECYLKAAEIISHIQLAFTCACLDKVITGVPRLEYIFDFDFYIESTNPYIMHEVGVIYYRYHKLDHALNHFLKLLKHLTKSDARARLSNLSVFLDGWIDLYWYPLYFNLGHTLFKMKKYFNALACFQKAVTNGQDRFTAWKMIAYCYIKLGRIYDANDALFKASIICPDSGETSKFVPVL